MIYDKTFENMRVHYKLDELYGEPDYEREHKSPDGKYIAYDYKVYVRKGDIRFTFYTSVHWKVSVTKIPWREFWTRVFVGKEIIRYTADHAADSEYLMHMIIEGLEQAEENDDESGSAF